MEEALFPLRGWADTCHDQGLTPAPKGPSSWLESSGCRLIAFRLSPFPSGLWSSDTDHRVQSGAPTPGVCQLTSGDVDAEPCQASPVVSSIPGIGPDPGATSMLAGSSEAREAGLSAQ